MCGFVCVVGTAGLNDSMRRAVEEGNKLLVNRGPDEGNTRGSANAHFGHRRLKVVDLSSGQQPMASPDGRFTLVYNGEIYNHRDIRRELESKGETFVSSSDTEVLLRAFMVYGEDCVRRLNGMFSFAVHNSVDDSLFFCRDRLGIKPLYYAVVPAGIVVASEIRAIVAFPGVDLTVDPDGAESLFRIRYVLAPKTIHRGIAKVRPGEWGWFRAGELSLQPYWDIPTGSNRPSAPGSEAEASEILRELLVDSVRCRLAADVPVGLMLSGGLDSTIIGDIVARDHQRTMNSFAIGAATPGQEHLDERGYAARVAIELGFNHTEAGMEADQYVDGLSEFAIAMDDVVADPASPLLAELSRVAKQDVTVALSGEGSDELFAGYSYELSLRAWSRVSRFAALPRPVKAMVGAFGPVSKRMRHYTKMSSLNQAEFLAEYCGPAGLGVDRATCGRLLGRGRVSAAAWYDINVLDMFKRAGNVDALRACLYVDSKTWLPDDLLTKADRMSMRHGLELRVPFLDHRIVEFSASLPSEWLLKQGADGSINRKHILKRTFSKRVPNYVLDREKQGFTLSWKSFMATAGVNRLRALRTDAPLFSVIDRNEVLRSVAECRDDDDASCQLVLTSLLLNHWLEYVAELVPRVQARI